MSDVVIVHCDEAADAAAVEAIGHLGGLVRDGLLRPFWQAHAHEATVGNVVATSWSAGEPVDGDLLTTLSHLREVRRIRLVTIATASLPAGSARTLACRADHLATLLTASQPAGVPFADIRVIAPHDLSAPTHLTDLFSAHAAANIVLFPEDRMSDAGFALPMVAAEPATFSLHVAVETATQIGLWRDGNDAPVDSAAPGLMAGDIRVCLTRSYARIAVAPPLPVERAIAMSDVLPVPPGIEPAPVPHQAAAQFATQLFDKFGELQFREPAPLDDGRERHSIRSTVGLLGREARTYIRSLPYLLRHGAVADLTYTAGEALTAALGESSVVQVVWEGKVPDEPGALPPPVVIDELRQRLLERLARPESPAFDQTIWSSIVEDIFAMVDGGPTSDGTRPPSVGTDRVAVVDPRAVAPNPGNDLDAAVKAIDAESLDDPRPTAVGRLSAHIRSEITRTDSYIDGMLDSITRQLDMLRSRTTLLLTVLAWFSGVLLAALLGSLVVFSGLATAIGVDTWDHDTRIRMLQIGFVLLVAALATILGAGLRGRPVIRVAFGVFGAVVLTGTVFSLARWGVTQVLPDPIGTIRLGEAMLVLTVLALCVLVIAFCAAQRTHRGRTAARVAGILLIVVATIVAVVAVVRPVGWFADMAPSSFRSLGIRLVATLTVVLGLVLLTSLILRVRENLTVDRLRADIRWASRAAESAAAERARLAQALRQWHGSAVAVARTVWSPFGIIDEGHGSSTHDLDVDGEIRKLQLYVNEPREEDLLGVMSRIRQEVADPGWLRRQYHVAVDAFQPRYAFRTGRALDPGSIRRPEADPAPEDPSLGSGQPGQGIRWMFADMLFGGSFDDELRSAGSRIALDAVLEMYFARGGSGDAESADLVSFGGALMEGEAPTLPVCLFTKAGLPVAGDSRAQYTSTIWWPHGITRPRTERRIDIRETVVSTDDPSSLVVSFLRSDWSEPMPLHHLPFAASTCRGDEMSPDGDDPTGDELDDVM